MLFANDLNLFYGMRPILRGVSFCVEEGETVSLVGGNAAGKTSSLRAIIGLAQLRSGKVRFEGNDIRGIEPQEALRLGIAFCKAERQLFPEMSVHENLEMGAYIFGRDKESLFDSSLQRVFTLFPVLKERLSQRAGTLSGGEQKMLAVGRALMARPKLLLLDEPSLGLAPQMVERLGHVILELNGQGLTLLIAEQNRSFASALSDRIYQLERGQITHEGAYLV